MPSFRWMIGIWTKPNKPLPRGWQPVGGVGVDGSGSGAGELNEPVSVLLGVEARLTMICPVAGLVNQDPKTGTELGIPKLEGLYAVVNLNVPLNVPLDAKGLVELVTVRLNVPHAMT